MRVLGKQVMERVIEGHSGKRRRVTKDAAGLAILHHIIFLKKLAKKCDNVAFRQRKMQINEDAVLLCAPDILTAFYETGKIKLKASMASTTGEKKQQTKNVNKSGDPTHSIFEDISDEDKEN